MAEMISHQEALQVLQDNLKPLGVEELETAGCAGRVLASDVVARLGSPPFNKAAMDGFAVRAADVDSLPAELRLAGETFAGQWPDFIIGPGRCARVATGAPVPEGADMVVMVEHTIELPDGRIRIQRLTGRNICDKGEDVAEGQTVLRAGQMLTPMRVGVAAAAGYDRLKVYRMPSAALLCTGAEVQEPGRPVGKGQIYNSNGPMLSVLLSPLSSTYRYLGIVGDDEEELRAAVTEGLSRDVLIVAGGISVGQYDLVPGVLEKLGVKIFFRSCAIRPGKPVLFGRRDKTCVWGLPGNPQSCFVVFHILVRAAIALMSGQQELPPSYKMGKLTAGFHNKPERKNFIPAQVAVRDGVNYLDAIAHRGSADIVGASAAQAYMVIPRGIERLERGQSVEFFDV